MGDRVMRVAVVSLSVLLVLNIAATGVLFFAYFAMDDRVENIEDDTEALSSALLQTGESIEHASGDGQNVTVERETGNLVAFDSGADSGVMFEYRYQPLPGESIYFDANRVTVEHEFQQSLQDAQEAVERSDYEPMFNGMAITLDTPERWEYISGESAGLAFAAHIASLDPDYEFNDDVVLTGRVNPDGNIGSVNHINSKGSVAGENGKELIVAPHSSAAVDPDGIEVQHVQTLDEALEYALEPVA